MAPLVFKQLLYHKQSSPDKFLGGGFKDFFVLIPFIYGVVGPINGLVNGFAWGYFIYSYLVFNNPI